MNSSISWNMNHSGRLTEYQKGKLPGLTKSPKSLASVAAIIAIDSPNLLLMKNIVLYSRYVRFKQATWPGNESW